MSGLLLLKSMLARPLVIIIPLLVSDVVETLHEWVTFIEKYLGKAPSDYDDTLSDRGIQ